MKKLLDGLVPHGAVTIALKMLLTFAFHAAYPTVAMVATIHAVLTAFAVALSLPIVLVTKYLRRGTTSYEARHESKA